MAYMDLSAPLSTTTTCTTPILEQVISSLSLINKLNTLIHFNKDFTLIYYCIWQIPYISEHFVEQNLQNSMSSSENFMTIQSTHRNHSLSQSKSAGGKLLFVHM